MGSGASYDRSPTFTWTAPEMFPASSGAVTRQVPLTSWTGTVGNPLTVTGTGGVAGRATATILLDALTGTATGALAVRGALGVTLDNLTVFHESAWMPSARPGGGPTTTSLMTGGTTSTRLGASQTQRQGV